MEQIDPDMLLSITVDEIFDILIVLHYLEITGKGMKREPQFYKVDTDFCIEKLEHVYNKILERHLEVKNVSK